MSVSFGKMAFAPKRIAFHILLAFGVFCLTVSGEKVTQVIFGQMGLSSTMYMGVFIFSVLNKGILNSGLPFSGQHYLFGSS